MSAQRLLISACAYAQSDQSPRFPREHFAPLAIQKDDRWQFLSNYVYAQDTRSLIRLFACARIRKIDGTQHFKAPDKGIVVWNTKQHLSKTETTNEEKLQ